MKSIFSWTTTTIALTYLLISFYQTHPLTVAFPFGQLDKQVLVHPHNLENMQRYYFIENLGLGLVRDSVESLQEYSPGLAASWAQVSEFEWAFELQKNLKWSDGSPLTAKEIAQNLENLARSNSRHVTILRKLKNIKIEDGRLSLIFTQPTNSSLLHELSLADAVIYKDPVEWKITTGGYYLDKRDDQNIYLKKNPHFVGAADYADSVRFVRVQADENRSHFLAQKVDLFLLPNFTFHERYKDLDLDPYQVISGDKNSIFFFIPEAHVDRESRVALAALVREYFRGAVGAAGGQTSSGAGASLKLFFEDQLVPLGYLGHLDSFKDGLGDSVSRKKINLNIEIMRNTKAIAHLFEGLKEFAAQRGSTINLIPAPPLATATPSGAPSAAPSPAVAKVASNAVSPAPALPPAKIDVRMNNFRGNQKDSLGSWSFLFTPKTGELSHFRKLIEADLEAAVAATDDNVRLTHLKNIHRIVLEEAIAIPFMSEAPKAFHRKNIDISRWNPFDMRLRLYDVRVK